MNTKGDSELSRIREARMRISEKFNHDPERLVKHYMELQKRHQDRLVYSTEAKLQKLPKEDSASGS
ncbi:MAG: hypothetical protein K8R46_02565 [Pirellulales bacterium]|nr:hypothetical protein [Pirellulales bacterium]